MKRKRIEEVYLLRSIAIMCVVTVHTVTRIIEIYGYGSILFGNQQTILMTIRLFATFGTPIFIFLSEFLLAYAYSHKIPDGFLKKRFKLILIPYISMAFLYAFIMMHETGSFGQDGEIFIYFKYVLENLYTGFYRHGYFIIVIFQFYFIHMLFYKKLKNISSKNLLISTFIVNVAFLMVFNFNNPYAYKYGFKIWRVATWGSFPAWIFYFAVGYTSGRDIEQFTKKLEEHKVWIFPMAILSGIFLVYMYLSGNLIENSSKRFDMVMFSPSMFLVIYYIGTKIKRLPRIFKFISRYSFGIFLFHMVFLHFETWFFTKVYFYYVNPFYTLVFMIGSSTLLSIITTYILSKFSFGGYIIGRLEKPEEI